MRQLRMLIIVFTLASCGQSTLKQLENAEALRLNGKKTEAIELTTEIIKDHSDIQRAYYYRGLAYLDLKQYRKALVDFDKIISLKPERPAGFYFEPNPNFPFASDEVKLTVKLNDAIFHRALSWYFLDSMQNSLSDFELCDESDMNYGMEAVIWKARIYFQLGRKETGCELCKKAMLKGKAEAHELFQKNCP